MPASFERPFDRLRCRVLLDMIYDLQTMDVSKDNARLIQLVRLQLPEEFRTRRILKPDEWVSGTANGWAPMAAPYDHAGYYDDAPGWSYVGPAVDAFIALRDSDSDVEASTVENVEEDSDNDTDDIDEFVEEVEACRLVYLDVPTYPPEVVWCDDPRSLRSDN